MKTFFSFVRVWQLAAVWLLVIGSVRAQGPTWQSAIASSIPSGTMPGGAAVVATATAANGDVYLVGNFTVTTLQLGSIQLQGNTHSVTNVVFVAKWSAATNQFAWGLQSASGGGLTVATGLAVRGTNVYVTGYFLANVQFGAITLAVPTTGDYNIFVTKVTDAGTSASFTWGQKIDSPTSRGLVPSKPAVAVEGANVYVVGNFSNASSATSPTGFGGLPLAAQGGYDVFVTKLVDAGTSGSFAWVLSAGGTDADNAFAVAVQGTNIYVAGYFNGVASFGPTTLTSAGGADGFVAKLVDAGTSGSFVWAKATGGSGDETPQALALTTNGVYVAGYFTGIAGFGGTALTSAGSTDGFVTKLTDTGTNGSFAWAQKVGGTGDDKLLALASSTAGVYAGGSFGGSASFGSTTLTSLGGTDAVVTKLTDAGSFAWALAAGSTGNDQALGLAVPASGNTIYVGGQVVLASSPATFGSVSIPGTNSGASAFLATLADGIATATTPGLSTTGLNIAPNPAHERTVVQLPAVAGAPAATLRVLDALGRAIRTQTVATTAKAELDLTGLAPGIYVVQVRAGGSTATQKVVVE